jgi:hypothetical protein
MTNRLIRRVALSLTFGFALPANGQTPSARPINPLATYPQRYALINREIPAYRTVEVDMESLGIDRRSTDGGKVEASCNASETRRIVATDFGEHGSTVTSFYFWNNSLFFVQILSQRSDDLYGPAVEKSDDRLYYLDGKLVNWLDGSNSPMAFNTRAARQTDQFIRTEASTFFARLHGCPATQVSVADTAAPQMVPAPAAYDTTMKVVDDIRERAYVAAMKSDLRNLATYEEQFAADNGGAYFAGQASLRSPLHGFSPSNFVTINANVIGGNPSNWSATATHGKSSKMCMVENGVINCVARSNDGGSRPSASNMIGGVSVPTLFRLASDGELLVPPRSYQRYQWDAPLDKPLCHISGHIEVIAGGSKDVEVVVMRGDDFQNYVNGHAAKQYFQVQRTSAVTLDVTIAQAGPFVLAISNAFSVVSEKKVRVTGLQAICR